MSKIKDFDMNKLQKKPSTFGKDELSVHTKRALSAYALPSLGGNERD